MFAKKNVVAAAALTLVAAAAHAQVTLYGNVDVSIGRKQSQTAPAPGSTQYGKDSRTVVDSSDMTDSFLGFKGQEDLGGGLKGLFKLETGLALDTGAAEGGTTTFWNRTATVGLAGDFGALSLGRAESLFRQEAGAFNPFGNSRTFSPTAILLETNGDFWSNSITYVSPNLGGLTLSAQHSAKESGKGNAAQYGGGATAVAANYVAGPLGLSAVYGDLRSADGLTAPDERDRAALVGVSYDFGAVKLFGQYSQFKLDDKDGTSPDEKLRFFQIGAAIPVSQAGAVLVSYGDSRNTADNTEGADKARNISLGYTHAISKRTSTYAAVTHQRVTDGLANDPDVKGKLTNFAVGVRHSF